MKVAVYGTLRAGRANHHRLGADAVKLSTERLLGFSMVSLGWFPACYVDEVGSGVVVEVYEISDEAFASCDRLEGYPTFYDRVEVETSVGTAWIYVQSKQKAARYPLVMGGDWGCA
jgi:gamma-glutamylcyclotransferase (GGCT)/AIG2-like uncharacterized protein YtfP